MARRSRFKPRQYPGASCGNVGALSELLVAVDLLGKGYEVYRSLSPNSSADLIVRIAGKAVPIEVRTGRRHSNGKFYYKKTNIRAEVLAVVLVDGIIYEPNLFSEHA